MSGGESPPLMHYPKFSAAHPSSAATCEAAHWEPQVGAQPQGSTTCNASGTSCKHKTRVFFRGHGGNIAKGSHREAGR